MLEKEDYFSELTKELTEKRTQWKLEFIEVRSDRQMRADVPCKQHKVTFLLPLPSTPDDLWNSFKSKLRSQIRRPQKEDMYIKHGGLEFLNDFYHVFSYNMRDLGTPVYSRKFFKHILEAFPENTQIVVVYTPQHKAVAASFLIKFRNTVEIPWASSLSEYNKFSPNMLLYWESIKWAIAAGSEVFDFGRCSPDSGTFRFKKQWGGEEKPLYWYYILSPSQELPQLNPSNPKYELAIKIWRRLPISLTRIIGPYIIKNIP
ncbi:MAG: hypothetical protein Kow0042_09470 [Calditrichia bacterium]